MSAGKLPDEKIEILDIRSVNRGVANKNKIGGQPFLLRVNGNRFQFVAITNCFINPMNNGQVIRRRSRKDNKKQ